MFVNRLHGYENDLIEVLFLKEEKKGILAQFVKGGSPKVDSNRKEIKKKRKIKRNEIVL